MRKTTQAQIDLIKHFANLCQKNQVWYVLDGASLLSAHRHGGFSLLSSHLEVLMSVESYRQLAKIAPQQVVDSFIDPRYKQLGASYVWDRKNWLKQSQHIKIRILVPSTTEKVKRFRSWKNFWLRKRFSYADNLWSAIEELHDHQPSGFYLLGQRGESVKRSWIVHFDPQTVEVSFHQMKLPCARNYPYLLERFFGSDWQTNQKFKNGYHYLTPLKRKRIKEDIWNKQPKQKLEPTVS
ncbi:hypothetical protein [Mycoplasma sp. ATU-Cv-508]|uniref:hypothetical protein n=1 Tax=Mycoplasma sp. ATU-Cv-508 TaxID=2048001 RepID=UPI000FDF5827